MKLPNLQTSISDSIYKFKRFVIHYLQLDEFQQLGSVIGFIGISFAVFAFYPMRKIFAGDWKVNQQITLKLWETDLSSGSSAFNGTLNIRFYSLCILLAVLFGYLLALLLSKKHYIVSTIVDRLLVGLVVFGLVGARLFFVLFNWEVFSVDRLQILFVYQGGLSFFGMFLGGLLYLWIYCLRFKFNIFEFLDFLAPSVLLGQIIGRFGNFFNYESYGGPTSLYWKMYVPDSANFYDNLNQKFFHPTFLYEIFPNFILLILLLWSYRVFTRRKAGIVFGLYAVGYGLIRFVVEFFRLDALVYNLPEWLNISLLGLTFEQIRVSQILSILLVVLGLVIIKIRSEIIYIRKTIEDIKVKKNRNLKV